MKSHSYYGIYLGLEYACLCQIHNGVPRIIKSEVTNDYIPCCVSFTKKGSILIGDAALNNKRQEDRRRTKQKLRNIKNNSFVEFQRTIGTGYVYHCMNSQKTNYTSEELSAEFLKALKSYVTDDNFRSVVVTVPAKFTVNQKTATIQAAKLAGFEHCELLQEPIAASMAYGLTSEQENGYWIVFDFGGGTFDAALLKVEDGIMQVFDTEGDNYLGGKNLDYALVDEIIIPYLKENYSIYSILEDEQKKEVLRDAMKTYAEELKNKLSFQEKEDIISDIGDLGEDDEGEEIELELTVTQEQAFDAMRPLYQKTVDICKSLLKRNNIKEPQLNKILLVGEQICLPLVSKMLKEQLTEKVASTILPMSSMAIGAALYATNIEFYAKEIDLEVKRIRLKVEYESTTQENTEFVCIQLDKTAKEDNCSEKIFTRLVRCDKAWDSGKFEIDTNGIVIELSLISGKSNSFSILTYDERGTALECYPNEVTIVHKDYSTDLKALILEAEIEQSRNGNIESGEVLDILRKKVQTEIQNKEISECENLEKQLKRLLHFYKELKSEKSDIDNFITIAIEHGNSNKVAFACVLLNQKITENCDIIIERTYPTSWHSSNEIITSLGDVIDLDLDSSTLFNIFKINVFINNNNLQKTIIIKQYGKN